MKVKKENCKAPTKLVLHNIRTVGVVTRKKYNKKKKIKKSRGTQRGSKVRLICAKRC